MDNYMEMLQTSILVLIIFAIISFAINLKFLKKIRRINPIKNLIFGLYLTLLGIMSIFLVRPFLYLNLRGVIMWIIPVYLIVTGFTLSLVGYLNEN